MTVRVALLLLVTACGRIAFDTGDSDNPNEATAAAYAAAVEGDNPIASFRFQETAGPTAYSEVGSYTGDYQGDFAFGAPGAVGDQTIAFDGSTTRIDLGDVFRFPGLVPYSIEIWILSKDNVDTRFVVDRRGTGGDGYHVYYGGTYLIFVRFVGLSESNYATMPSGPSIGRWHHVVSVFDGTSTRIYVDGTERGCSIAAQIEIGDQPGSFVIGDDTPPQFNKVNGRLDELAIYDYALSADQVRAHFAASGH